MKKIFIAMMAMAAFAACATEDTLVAPKGNAIAFGDAFVDNSTKAIYENGTVPTQFKVWGNVAGKVAQGQAQSFVALYGEEGATVKGSGVEKLYTCDKIRYWTPSCDFNFAAIVNGSAKTVVNGMPTVISYTAEGDNDLLYASATAATNEQGTPSGAGTTTIEGEATPVVAFTFKHLLSRIAFKFTVAASLNEDYSYDVTDVKVAGAFATGECTPAGVWSEQKGIMVNPLTFGNVTNVATAGSSATGAYVIIPGTPTLTITFNAVCKLNGDTIKTYNYTKTVDTQEFLANNAYTFVAELPVPGKEIKFTVVEVDGFTTPADGNVTVQ
ncbi:MAG: fimbrillin family protein [Alistipes sp.]|nr:fimbrillin family protein [Alistipes sp.]